MDWHVYAIEFRQDPVSLGIWTFNQIQPQCHDVIIIDGISYTVTSREYVAQEDLEEGVPIPILYVQKETQGVIPA